MKAPLTATLMTVPLFYTKLTLRFFHFTPLPFPFFSLLHLLKTAEYQITWCQIVQWIFLNQYITKICSRQNHGEQALWGYERKENSMWEQTSSLGIWKGERVSPLRAFFLASSCLWRMKNSSVFSNFKLWLQPLTLICPLYNYVYFDSSRWDKSIGTKIIKIGEVLWY